MTVIFWILYGLAIAAYVTTSSAGAGIFAIMLMACYFIVTYMVASRRHAMRCKGDH